MTQPMFELLQQIGNTVKLKHSSHSLAMMKAGGRGGVTVFEGFFAFSVLELFVAFVLAVDFGAAAALDFVLVPPALDLAIELDFNLAASEVEDFLVAEAFRFVDCETPVRSGAPAAAERAPR